MKGKIEILAPAGGMDCLKAAVAAGADAVYVGGSMFGARAYANNFSEEELSSMRNLARMEENGERCARKSPFLRRRLGMTM